MRSLVFDAGPIISLTLNNLLWVIPSLKDHFDGKFYITTGVKKELIEKPLTIRRFKFEALQTLRLVNDKTIDVLKNDEVRRKANQLMDLANSSFYAFGHPIRLVQLGEMESIAAALYLEDSTVVIDERTSRKLIEDPDELIAILSKRMRTKVKVDRSKLRDFQNIVKGLNVIRSVELVIVAYEKGFMDEYLPRMRNAHHVLLDALLWGVKLSGCAVSKDEILEILNFEATKKAAIKNRQ